MDRQSVRQIRGAKDFVQETIEECEALAFSPWNALAEHRPMGGINRLRQAVYLASQAKRAAQRVP